MYVHPMLCMIKCLPQFICALSYGLHTCSYSGIAGKMPYNLHIHVQWCNLLQPTQTVSTNINYGQPNDLLND